MFFFEIITPIIEIGFIAVILNYLLSFFWNTRSMDLLVGLAAFFIVFTISWVLNLPILYTMMTKIASVAAVGLIILFQPELRIALSKITLKGKKNREVTEFDKFLDKFTSSVYRFAEKQVGALIVLENTDRLDEFGKQAVKLNALFSPELLETIFFPSTALHDGAVVIRLRNGENGHATIVAAGAILPLAEERSKTSHSMGTRHLAALGISQATDAVVVVVSEETGNVSIARAGVISRVKEHQFHGIIHSVYQASHSKQTPKWKWVSPYSFRKVSKP